MSPAPSTRPTLAPQLRRRSLAAVATFAGVGASLTVFALAPTAATTATSGAAISPVAAARAAVTSARSTATKAVAPARTRTSVTAARASSAHSARAVSPAAKTKSAPAARTHEMAMTGSSCGGATASLEAFMQHFYAAHLETSPGQQVADASDVDQYTKTHTVLIENMIKPLVGGSGAAADAFMQHFNAAHLETSPGQQVADATDVDQYTKTHTVLIENMLKALVGGKSSSC